jgi:hypothetical protein
VLDDDDAMPPHGHGKARAMRSKEGREVGNGKGHAIKGTKVNIHRHDRDSSKKVYVLYFTVL